MDETGGITRRDFLTLRKSEPTIDRKLQDAIQSELGIKPGKVELHMVFGNHVLTPAHLQDIGKKGANVIVGEFKKTDLVGYPNQGPPAEANLGEDIGLDKVMARLLYPGEGTSAEERAFDINARQSLLKRGVILGALDSEVFFHGDLPFLLPVGIEAALITMVAALPIYASLASVMAHKGAVPLHSVLTRRKLLTSTAATVAGLYLAKKGADIAGIDILKGKLKPREISLTEGPGSQVINTIMGAEINFEEARRRFGMDKSTFGTYTQAIVDFRNKQMALNAWHSVARFAEGKGVEAARLYFLAGGAHANIYHEFLLGAKKLELEIEKYAAKLTSESLDKLIDMWDAGHDESGIDYHVMTDDFVDNYLQLTNMFGKPYFVGSQIPPSASPSLKLIPQTPQAILIDTIIQTVSQLRHNPSFRSARKTAILENVFGKIAMQIQNEGDEKSSGDSVGSAGAELVPLSVSQKARDEIVSTRFSGFTDYIKQATDKTSETGKTVLAAAPQLGPNGMVIIGIAKYNGQYYKVGRDFRIDSANNKITTVDMLLLPDDRFIELGISDYYPVEDEQVANSADTLVYFEKKTWEGMSSDFTIKTARGNRLPANSSYVVTGYGVENIGDETTLTDNINTQIVYRQPNHQPDWAGIDRIAITDIKLDK